MAPGRDSEEADIFAESVRESLSIIEKMMRKGSTGKSGAEDVKGAMKFIEAYVALADPDWEALEDHKRYAIDPSTDDDVDMGEPHEGDGTGTDEPRQKAASTLKRASPTPERPGKEINSDADDENVTSTESEATEREANWPSLPKAAGKSARLRV